MFNQDTLKGRIAFITGGGGGIGLEIATCYARLGASVAIAGRSEERLKSAVEALGAPLESATIFPSSIRIVRLARAASEVSCVTITSA